MVLGHRQELDREGCGTGVGVELPQSPERHPAGENALDARQILLGPATEDLDEEVVHAMEVVVHELRFEAGLGPDPA